jgi:cytochrome c peroxidase
MFHLDSNGRIACAQCHPEGGEDGRVWLFDPKGPRRTQAVNVGLAGTEPLHWDGDLPTLEALVDEVFVRRMGGQKPAVFVLDSLTEWLASLSPPAPIVEPGAPAAERGRALFESTEVGCAECHAGPVPAKSDRVDVGVDSPHAFQIPPLRGVGYRAPFLHDGCAKTLRERFEPPCGGDDRHGKTSQLSPAELDDLIAYLQSL